MLLHTPKMTDIKQCLKRANAFAAEGVVSGKHAVWLSNAYAVQENRYDIFPIAWLASKINTWAETNILEGDASMAALLYEWKSMLFFDPEKLSDAPQDS